MIDEVRLEVQGLINHIHNTPVNFTGVEFYDKGYLSALDDVMKVLGKVEQSHNIRLGRKIRSLRVERGLTLQEFGELFEPQANKSVVSSWEKGRHVPNQQRLKNIANMFGVTVDELTNQKENENE